jgi:hypothetical protein
MESGDDTTGVRLSPDPGFAEAFKPPQAARLKIVPAASARSAITASDCFASPVEVSVSAWVSRCGRGLPSLDGLATGRLYCAKNAIADCTRSFCPNAVTVHSGVDVAPAICNHAIGHLQRLREASVQP